MGMESTLVTQDCLYSLTFACFVAKNISYTSFVLECLGYAPQSILVNWKRHMESYSFKKFTHKWHRANTKIIYYCRLCN